MGAREALRERYEQVSAYHNNNYRPLMWGFYRPYRAELFRLSHVLTFRAATHDQSLIEALHFIQRFQHTRRDYLPAEIALDFASVRWQALIRTRRNMQTVLHRRHLEVCVFPLSRPRSALWGCVCRRLRGLRRLPAAASAVGRLHAALTGVLPGAPVRPHRGRLRGGAPRTAAGRVPSCGCHVPRQHCADHRPGGHAASQTSPAQPTPEALHTIEAVLKERMPERHLLDILKNVHHWVHYTRHFGPPSGADPKLTEPVLRYIFTIFGYASELGASQTARHTNGLISRQVLRRMNDQHITTTKLEASLRDVIEEYTRFELPFLWGSGQGAIADGTHIALLQE